MARKITVFLLGCQLLWAGSALALLRPETEAPDFTLEAALAGQPFTYTLSESLAKGPVVLYFYPKAFTGGCSVEARLFARAKDDFAALGATIIGVSNDSIDILKDFSTKDCANSFPVAADPDGRVIRTYDVSMLPGSSTSKRSSYVITPDHRIFYVYSDMSPKEHVTKTLDALKRWKSLQANQAR